MNNSNKGVLDLTEGYQPILKNHDSDSVKLQRPEPPKGGSGVPNLFPNHYKKIAVSADNTGYNR